MVPVLVVVDTAGAGIVGTAVAAGTAGAGIVGTAAAGIVGTAVGTAVAGTAVAGTAAAGIVGTGTAAAGTAAAGVVTGAALSGKTSHSEDWYHDNDKLDAECDNIKTTYAYKSTKILFGRLDQVLAFVEMSKDKGLYDKYTKLKNAYDLVKKEYDEGYSVKIDVMRQLEAADLIINEFQILVILKVCSHILMILGMI